MKRATNAGTLPVVVRVKCRSRI